MIEVEIINGTATLTKNGKPMSAGELTDMVVVYERELVEREIDKMIIRNLERYRNGSKD